MSSDKVRDAALLEARYLILNVFAERNDMHVLVYEADPGYDKHGEMQNRALHWIHGTGVFCLSCHLQWPGERNNVLPSH